MKLSQIYLAGIIVWFVDAAIRLFSWVFSNSGIRGFFDGTTGSLINVSLIIYAFIGLYGVGQFLIGFALMREGKIVDNRGLYLAGTFIFSGYLLVLISTKVLRALNQFFPFVLPLSRGDYGVISSILMVLATISIFVGSIVIIKAGAKKSYAFIGYIAATVILYLFMMIIQRSNNSTPNIFFSIMLYQIFSFVIESVLLYSLYLNKKNFFDVTKDKNQIDLYPQSSKERELAST